MIATMIHVHENESSSSLGGKGLATGTGTGGGGDGFGAPGGSAGVALATDAVKLSTGTPSTVCATEGFENVLAILVSSANAALAVPDMVLIDMSTTVEPADNAIPICASLMSNASANFRRNGIGSKRSIC